MPKEQALYVIVRKDLSKSRAAVQAGHALAQFLLEHKTPWSNGTLVYLAAANEVHLNSLKDKLFDKTHSEFREPDLGNQLTAIAVLGSQHSETSDFEALPLL